MPSRYCKYKSFRYLLLVPFLSCLTGSLWLVYVSRATLQVEIGELTAAQSPSISQMTQQGMELYQVGDIQNALAHWHTALDASRKANAPKEEATILENLAVAYQQIGQSDRAISNWTQAIAIYRRMKNRRQVVQLLIEQAQAYSSLGQHRRAVAILCNSSSSEKTCTEDSALQLARKEKDISLEAAALGSLGNAYYLRGEYAQAIQCLKASQQLATETKNSIYYTSAVNNLGNVHVNLALVNYRRSHFASARGDSDEAEKLKKQALNYDTEALQYYQKSLDVARIRNDIQGQVRSLLNSIPSYYRTQVFSSAAEAIKQALLLLKHLPDSRDKVYASISLANLLQPTTLIQGVSFETQCFKPQLANQAEELLRQALLTAQRLKDSRAESFALGKLGHIYECRKDYNLARRITQQAQLAANQQISAKDSLYLWQWQAGRILKAQGKRVDALDAYEQAVATLEEIRNNILIANQDLQFDFRDTVEPVYRELVELRLEQNSLLSTKSASSSKNLRSVLTTIDSLKLAELQNYFGNDCVFKTITQDKVDSLVGAGTSTAVFNSIILKDRTAIIVSFPNGEKKFSWIDIDNKNFEKEINEYRKGLESFFDDYDPRSSQKLYNLLIRPFASDLARSQIKTLVFVHDGILRSVPMAALHDGQKFLIQSYAIATTPTVTLTEAIPQKTQEPRALVLGLTKSTKIDGRQFPALNNVSLEVKEIKTKIPGSKQLLDDDFTSSRLQQELSKNVYPIIHMATHGEFGTEPEDTFIVTGQNEKLTIDELDSVIRGTTQGNGLLELLALTACQTAVGDNRAALGLAGVAVRAGAKSALASLWFIDDTATTELAKNFYTHWRDRKLTKAQSLQAAQLAMIESGDKYSHPAYWAPFILIGNWQ